LFTRSRLPLAKQQSSPESLSRCPIGSKLSVREEGRKAAKRSHWRLVCASSVPRICRTTNAMINLGRSNAGLNALQGLNGRNGRSLGGRTHTRRKMSLAARRRIARAQKLRWARYHAKRETRARTSCLCGRATLSAVRSALWAWDISLLIGLRSPPSVRFVCDSHNRI
jgi:hypothetical protein